VESHTRARARSPRLAGRAGGRAGRRARAHDMRVNGPPKSGPSPWRGRGYLLPFDFLVSWLLRLS
jgi:hypothetical protein